MWHDLLSDASVFSSLLVIDRARARVMKAEGCLRCGGKLDVAAYTRMAGGVPGGVSAHLSRRDSFCCRDCRRRSTPPTARFLGQRAYVSVVVALAAVLSDGPTAMRITALSNLIGASRRTVKRWIVWWREGATKSLWWAMLVARAPIVDTASSALDAFIPTASNRVDALVNFLRFIANEGSAVVM